MVGEPLGRRAAQSSAWHPQKRAPGGALRLAVVLPQRCVRKRRLDWMRTERSSFRGRSGLLRRCFGSSTSCAAGVQSANNSDMCQAMNLFGRAQLQAYSKA